MRRLIQGATLLAAGLLAGALGYGSANLVPTFAAVPLEQRLDFHAELMKVNGVTVQGAMIVALLGSVVLAVLSRGRERAFAAGAGLLVLATLLITRFGNVPINGQIKRWAADSPPAGYAEILHRWELFNVARTFTGVVAFVLLIAVTTRAPRPARR